MKSYFYLLLLAVFFSCSDDDPETSNLSQRLMCLEDERDILLPEPECDNLSTSAFFCELIEVGEFDLLDSSKEFMPYACEDTGTTYTYQNPEGDLLTLEQTAFSFIKTSSTLLINDSCENDTINNKGLCIIGENIFVSLRSDISPLQIQIRLKVLPDFDISNLGGVGDFLEITRKTGQNAFRRDIQLLLDQRTLNFEPSPLQEFYDTIILNGQEFNNVFSQDISVITSPTYKYYYNKESGLVGFEDLFGVIWARI